MGGWRKGWKNGWMGEEDPKGRCTFALPERGREKCLASMFEENNTARAGAGCAGLGSF
jgi:hypothetical protein